MTETQARARKPGWINLKWLGWAVGGVLLLGLLAMLTFVIAYFQPAPADVRAVRSFILPPENSMNSREVAVSPDGRRLAFGAWPAEGKRVVLWVRDLGALSARPLAGTEGARFSFWSPDSRFIGFFADRKLKKIEAAGGPPTTLCDAPEGRDGTWNPDGVIVYSAGALQRVPASGGAPSPFTKLDEARGEAAHRYPWFLPDGQHFLYESRVSVGETRTDAIYVASLESQEPKLLLRAGSSAAYAQGYLLFVRERTLFAQSFDANRLELVGDAFPIAEQAQLPSRATYSVSEQGVLAYRTIAGTSQLIWYDRTGKQLGVLGDPARYLGFSLSPDGKRVAVMISDPQTASRDIWLYEVARGLKTRFTFNPALETRPTWSPDGSRIVLSSNRKGRYDLYQQASSLAGSEELLLESNLSKYADSWSGDGRFLLYSAVDPKTGADMWIFPMVGDRKPLPFLQTEFDELDGQFSPDGRWIAYTSDESRRYEIYVAPFPGPGGKRLISASGGWSPRWRGDGKEIFYSSLDGKLMAAEVSGKGPTLEVGAVRALFEVPRAQVGFDYDVTADGQRFLVDTAVEQGASAPISLVLNWTADLKR